MISREQIHAARALLQWRPEDLADAAGLDLQTVLDFERGTLDVSRQEDVKPTLSETLEKAGISFIADDTKSVAGGPGLRLSAPLHHEGSVKDYVQYPDALRPDASTGAGG